MQRAVFLDRDGVINRAMVRNGRPYAPTSLAEFVILDGAPEAVRCLKAAGFLIIVVTNQPDLATGLQSQGVLDQMHIVMRESMDIDAIYVCPHDDAANCDCRKPRPGMLLTAARHFDIDLQKSWMIGDRWRDVEAGRAAGCRTIFIDRGYREVAPQADYRVSELPDAVPLIVQSGI
jgi:D-glycero-D-manno-heptose 1,7-bisphosphate phosphatase